MDTTNELLDQAERDELRAAIPELMTGPVAAYTPGAVRFEVRDYSQSDARRGD